MIRAISKRVTWNERTENRRCGRRRRIMKNVISCLVVIFVLALGSAAAQSRAILKANVPFDFTIGEAHLSSGTYTVRQVGTEVEMFCDGNGRGAAMFLTTPMSNLTADANRYVLEFERYGDQYVLSQVWTGQQGHAVYINKKKVQLAKAGEPETVLVAMQFEK
jgi:hypothetical protein